MYYYSVKHTFLVGTCPFLWEKQMYKTAGWFSYPKVDFYRTLLVLIKSIKGRAKVSVSNSPIDNELSYSSGTFCQ